MFCFTFAIDGSMDWHTYFPLFKTRYFYQTSKPGYITKSLLPVLSGYIMPLKLNIGSHLSSALIVLIAKLEGYMENICKTD